MARLEKNPARSLRPRLRQLWNALLTRRSILSNPFVSAKLHPLVAESDYAVLTAPEESDLGGELPTPPRELWERWGDTLETYLDTGRRDVERMLEILAAVGAAVDAPLRVLDFGCAEGRMLRFFPASGGSELWGVDVNARRIAWAQQHLPLPLRFATTTTAPHLPFADEYFDLVYGYSVFTHISDLADAWFLELLRVLRPGGHVYVTIHDEHTVELLLGRYRGANAHVVELVRRLEQETDLLASPWVYLVAHADPGANVFYRTEYLVEKWSAFAECCAIRPEAAEYQTALVFMKRER